MVMPSHEPDKASRDKVESMAALGIPQEDIARVIGICHQTLRKHYRDELDNATTKANTQIGGALFRKALSGDTASLIFWMKTRAGWKETNVTETRQLPDALTPTDEEIIECYARSTDKTDGA